MTGKPQIPWPEPSEVVELAAEATTQGQLARLIGERLNRPVTRSAFESYLGRNPECREAVWPILAANREREAASKAAEDVANAGISTNDDGSLAIASEIRATPPAPWKPDEVMRAHGQDPDEFIIVRVRFNRWGAPEAPMHQLRFDAIPRDSIIRPADPTTWKPPRKPRRPRKQKMVKSLVVSDLHAPRHDRGMHQVLCDWLADEQPDRGVFLGDLLDFETISRHRPRERPRAANEGIQAAHEVLRDWREASPDTRWVLIEGNHDFRIRSYLIDNAPNAYGITAANDELPALHLRRLLHLDELGVEWVDEDWDRAHVLLSRHLAGMHRAAGGKNAAVGALDKFSHSILQGDTHRLRLVYRTEYEHTPGGDVDTSTRMAAEIGCLAEIKDGLSYAKQPDWQNGAMVVYTWPDTDEFSAVPLVYVGGHLLTPGRRYVARSA